MCNTARAGPLSHIEPGSARPDIARTTSSPIQGVAHTLRTQRISGDDLLEYARVPGMAPAVPGALA